MDEAQEFEAFVSEVEPRLSRALVAVYGFERGRDATAEALGWAWEHRDQLGKLDSPVAYLFASEQVGPSAATNRSYSKGPSTPSRGSSQDSGRLWRI